MRDSTGGVSGGVHKVHGGSAFLKAVGSDHGGSEQCALAQPQAVWTGPDAPGGAAAHTAPPIGSTYDPKTEQGSQGIISTGWQGPQAAVLRAPAASDAFPFQPSLAYAPPQPHHHHHPSAPTMQHPSSHSASQHSPYPHVYTQPQGVYYATGEQQHGQAYTWQSYHAHSTTTAPTPTHSSQPSLYSCSAPGSFCITGGVTTWHTNPQQQQYLYQQHQHQHQQMLIHSTHYAGHPPPHAQSAAALGSGGVGVGGGGGGGNVDHGSANSGADYDPTADVDTEPGVGVHGGAPSSVQDPACGPRPSAGPSASPRATLHGQADQQHPQDCRSALEDVCRGSGGCAGGGVSNAPGAGHVAEGIGARESQAAGEQPGGPGVEAGGAADMLPSSAHAPTNGAGQPCAQAVVVVWDLDETLIVFNSLLSGAFAKAMGAAAAAATAAAAEGEGGLSAPALGGAAWAGAGAGAGSEGGELLAARALALGQRMADIVFDFCDAHLGFNLVS